MFLFVACAIACCCYCCCCYRNHIRAKVQQSATMFSIGTIKYLLTNQNQAFKSIVITVIILINITPHRYQSLVLLNTKHTMNVMAMGFWIFYSDSNFKNSEQVETEV